MAGTGMLIRQPVAEVFEAFVNPGITTMFWFTKGSGRLEAGRQARWEWKVGGVSIPVTAKAIEPKGRIFSGLVARRRSPLADRGATDGQAYR